jgi:hypothetical protein
MSHHMLANHSTDSQRGGEPVNPQKVDPALPTGDPYLGDQLSKGRPGPNRAVFVLSVGHLVLLKITLGDLLFSQNANCSRSGYIVENVNAAPSGIIVGDARSPLLFVLRARLTSLFV